MEYIYEIYKRKNKENINEKDMEIEFFKKYNRAYRASFDVLPDLDKMRIVVVDGIFRHVKTYIATDYDCVPVKEVPEIFKELPKSSFSFNDEEMKKFYIDYMKKNFKSYEEDYDNNQNNTLNNNLSN